MRRWHGSTRCSWSNPRPATFLALERAALEGLDFATLRDTAALREL